MSTKRNLKVRRDYSQVPPLDGVFDPIVIWVRLEQMDNNVEEFFFVEKAVIEPPIVLVT